MERIGIELEEAVKLILDATKNGTGTKRILVSEAGGRTLAEAFYAPMDNPPFDRSPLDGYALRSQDTKGASPEHPAVLTVVDTVYAGGWCTLTLKGGQAVCLTTGAPIAEGADCIIRQEDVKRDENGMLEVYQELMPYENYCFAGEDVKKGTLLIEKGTRITYVEQAILASMGIEEIAVFQKPRAALLVTGDELIMPGQKLVQGKIYDSNLQMIFGRMQEMGITPVVAKQAGDSAEEVAQEILGLLPQVDAVITTGGVSVGAKDIFHQVLPLIKADRLFWRVKLKPGTPAMFAVCQGVPLLHLSGNPFAAITTFELLARPMLEKLNGNSRQGLERVQAVLDGEFEKSSMGRRFLRGTLIGQAVMIPPTGKHSSGMISSMSGCNCLIDIPAGSEKLVQGSQVEVLKL